MAIESHLSELSEKHKQLDCDISEAMQHPSVDTLKIMELKREKLRLKEEMERLRHSSAH
ncbi:MAG: DUF465 domain-containing protein [Alphaproteobacteria bacterium]|nr:MAG: DUF465 domain-containing protein [Alphaproteobacteria bacterium]